MWIEPNGVVKILHDVPLDNDYNNTLYFANKNDQVNYFNSLVKFTYNKITYQRIKRNYMRVEINAEQLYDCNYLMFQNTSFGNRWFYAFIIKVEYIANTVSEIEYEIDEMQTWFPDCQVKECFIEREHSLTDNIGDNLIDEGLELGDYVMHRFSPAHASLDYGTKILDEQVIVVATTFNSDYTDYDGGMINRIFSGLKYHWFHLTPSGISSLQSFIDGAIQSNKKDGIIDIFQVPEYFILSLSEGGGDYTFTPYKFPFGETKPLANIDGYYPRNNKLFTYPYNFLYVTDGHGNSAEYHYEYFTGDSYEFEYSLTMSCDPSMQIAPKNYKGINGVNYNERMVYKGFPHCSWDSDMWKAWVSQNGGTLMAVGMPVAGSMIAIGAGVSMGNNIAIAGGVLGIMNTLKEVKKHSTMPPQASGNYNGDVIYSNKINDFWYGAMHIRSEYAKIIDEFFTMFGYATKRTKVPNINTRPHWNYVKTIDANIIGSIPADSLEIIKKNFNKGITFWKHGSEVGDYSLDNRPA